MSRKFGNGLLGAVGLALMLFAFARFIGSPGDAGIWLILGVVGYLLLAVSLRARGSRTLSRATGSSPRGLPSGSVGQDLPGGSVTGPAISDSAATPSAELARLVPAGEGILVTLRGLRPQSGLVLTGKALYLRNVSLTGKVEEHRWPLWAVVDLKSSGQAVRIVAQEDDVTLKPPKTYSVIITRTPSAGDVAIPEFRRLRAQLGPPGSDSAILAELEDVTESWQAHTLGRRYRDNAAGQARLRKDTALLGRHGYGPAVQTSEKGSVKARQLIAFGLPGAAIQYTRGKGGIHRVGVINATFVRSQGQPVATDTIASQIERLAALRNSGDLTVDQFEDAKRRVLGV